MRAKRWYSIGIVLFEPFSSHGAMGLDIWRRWPSWVDFMTSEGGIQKGVCVCVCVCMCVCVHVCVELEAGYARGGQRLQGIHLVQLVRCINNFFIASSLCSTCCNGWGDSCPLQSKKGKQNATIIMIDVPIYPNFFGNQSLSSDSIHLPRLST